jgi:predicted porin
MQKKILALAIAAAFSAPAFADNANISFYGKAFGSVDSSKSDNVGLDAAGNKVSNSINTVHTNASRFGLKGEDDLGDGLKATFQYEAEFNLDANSNAATGGSGNAFMGTRNSKVGLASGIGEFFVGNWDTPYKLSHNPIELNDNTTFGSQTNLVGRFGNSINNATGVTTTSVSLNTRLKDSFNYVSPNLSGFQFKFALGFDDAKAAVTATPAAAGTNQQVMAWSLAYDNEMFYAALAQQNHKDTNGIGATAAAQTALGSKTNGTRLVGQFKLGTAGFVGAMIESLKVTNAGVDTTQRNIELSGKYAFTPADSIGLAYVKAGSKSSGGATVGDSATQITLRYGHNYSKRTELYAMYTQLKNGQGNGTAVASAAGPAAANYNFNAGTGTAIANSQGGATLTALGVGMIVNF